MSKKYYPAIDVMRIISSLLVIAIHTDPFTTLNPNFNFFITRILGRLAVPFFFITTSYFLFQHGMPTFEKLKSVLKQFIIIDICSILLYIPVQMYNHSLTLVPLQIMKDLFMDGTFYHLWYLPAVIIGLIIVYLLSHFSNEKVCFVIVIILYIIGLGGDSYYGLFQQIPLLKSFYDILFIISDYTRNGLFFAPLFIWLGLYLAQHHIPLKKQALYLLTGVAFLAMSLESILLHQNNIIRHDAMMICLPIIMIFLFQLLLSYPSSKRFLLFKDLSLYVYILHPLMIIVVRLIAKITHLENLLVTQSFHHFVVVTMLSFIVAYLLIFIKKGILKHGYHTNPTQLD